MYCSSVVRNIHQTFHYLHSVEHWIGSVDDRPAYGYAVDPCRFKRIYIVEREAADSYDRQLDSGLAHGVDNLFDPLGAEHRGEIFFFVEVVCTGPRPT